MTSSSSYSSSSQSNGVLEIDLDRLPPFIRTTAPPPATSIGSSPLSNRNHSRNVSTRPAVSRFSSNTEYTRFGKLIGNLRKILNDNEWDFSDAEIVVDDIPVGVNRLVLASMSSFFHELFRKQKAPCAYRPKFYISDLVPNGKVGYEAFLLFLDYLNTGNLKSYPEEVSKCIHDNCLHDTCNPAIDFQLQLLYASAAFKIDELVSLLQTDLFNVIEKALVEDVIQILVVAFRCKLNLLQDQCIKRVAQSDIHNLWIDRMLPYELQLKVRLFRVEFKKESDAISGMEFPDESRMKRIYQAMDTNDVETLFRLLFESTITLDETYGLHYAVGYCEPKVVSSILALGAANVNLKNPRGFTVLHMAARRMHPAILECLLLHGACASDLTYDGQSAVSICRRMTTVRDFEANEKSSKAANNYQLCIEILERWVPGSASSVNLLCPIYSIRHLSDSAYVHSPQINVAEDVNMVELDEWALELLSRNGPSKHHEVAYFNEPLAKLRKCFTTVVTLLRIIQMMRPQRHYWLRSDGMLQALSHNSKFEGGNIYWHLSESAYAHPPQINVAEDVNMVEWYERTLELLSGNGPSKHHEVAYFNEPFAKLRKCFTTVVTLVRIIRMMRPQRHYRLGSDGILQALSLNSKFEGGNIYWHLSESANVHSPQINVAEDENMVELTQELLSRNGPSKHHEAAYFNEPLGKLHKCFTTVVTLVRIIRMMRPQRHYRLGSDGILQALSLNSKFEGGNILRH